MLRLAAILFSIIATTLAGTAVIAALSAGYDTLIPILIAAAAGLLAAFLTVFIQSIEEFAIAFILGSPDFTTIPTLLYPRLGQDFVRPDAAVLSLILVLPNVILMLILEQLLRSANPSLSSGKG